MNYSKTWVTENVKEEKISFYLWQHNVSRDFFKNWGWRKKLYILMAENCVFNLCTFFWKKEKFNNLKQFSISSK